MNRKHADEEREQAVLYYLESGKGMLAVSKEKRIYRRHYETEIELRQDMFKYVELFYNRKRRHSYLGYKSPVEYRNDYERNQAA